MVRTEIDGAHAIRTTPARERAFGGAAARTSLVVGTALTLINHPEVLRVGLTPDLVVPLLLNYIVPFLVAGYSRLRLLARIGRRHLGSQQLTGAAKRKDQSKGR